VTAGSLRARHYRLRAVIGADEADDTPTDEDLAAADEQVTQLRRALARGWESPFTASLYVLLRARTRADLDRLTRQARDAVARLNGRLSVAYLQQEQGFHSCLPEARDELSKTHLLETSSLVTMYPFPPTALRMEGGVPFGYDRRSHAPVELDLFDDRTFRSANALICAPSGGGKSFFAKPGAPTHTPDTPRGMPWLDRPK
jgi:hypothetical protein